MQQTSHLKEDRLEYWSKLVRGKALTSKDIDHLRSYSLPLAKENTAGERISTALLFGAAHLVSKGTSTTKVHLRAALIYWFSSQGEQMRPPGFDPRDFDPEGVEEVIGLDLTWKEAMETVDKNPNRTAFSRIKDKLRRSSLQEWRNLFDCQPPQTFRDNQR